MLQNSLYYIVQSHQDGYTIRFDASHPIFAGHFPEHPIVSGACLVQIAEELISTTEAHPVRFTQLSKLRFSCPVTPDQEVTITIRQIEDKSFYFQFSVNDTICAFFGAK